MTQAGGSGKNREAGKASVSEVSVSKASDEATVPLFQEACKGSGTEVKIDLCTVQNDALKPYLQYTFKETMISSYSLSTGGERPTEQLSLNFTHIEAKLTPYNQQGKPGSPVSASYNLKTTEAA
jgi:type VI secretion system secreted protein Hcp